MSSKPSKDHLEFLVRAARQRLAEDGGRLWGHSASPRWILAEADVWWLTEPVDGAVEAAALWRSRPDPATGVASTHVRWRGQSWAMVDCLSSPPTVRELLHEAFHAFWQPGRWDWVVPADGGDDSLALAEPRAALRVELRAWARGLATENRVDLAAANAIRQWRVRLLGAEERCRQEYLDLWEGLAEYTARKWSDTAVAEVIELAEKGPSATSWHRSFCYTTGPVLGWALDLLQPSWRSEVRVAGSLTALLDHACGPSSQPLEMILDQLGYDQALAAETADRADRDRADDLVRKRFSALVWIPLRGGIQFDPREVRAWDLGTFYRTLSIQTDALQLRASEGAVVTPNWKWVGLPSPTPPAENAAVLDGPGWLLTISDPAVVAELSWGTDPPGG